MVHKKNLKPSKKYFCIPCGRYIDNLKRVKHTLKGHTVVPRKHWVK